MDFDLALFLMINSLRSPAKLYQHTKRLKQIRNQWHRDDPCLVTATSVLLFIVGLLYAFLLGRDFPFGYLLCGLQLVFLHFILLGIVVSTFLRWIAHSYMTKEDKASIHKSLNTIEPMYAFDVHCNSFFPLFVISYVGQVSLTSEF